MVLTLQKLTTELADNAELYEMSKEEGDDTGLETIEAETAKLRPLIDRSPWWRYRQSRQRPSHGWVWRY